MRSPVTELINGFNALNEVERAVFLDQVDPQPEPTAPAKQTRKKRGKSAKAQSLSNVIAKTPKADAEEGAKCTYQYPKGGPVNSGQLCDEDADNGVHDPTLGYVGYHPFEAPALPAGKKSSRKSAAPSLIPSIGTEEGNASAVGASGD